MKPLLRPKTARNWRQSSRRDAPAEGRGLECVSTNARGKCAARVFVCDEGGKMATPWRRCVSLAIGISCAVVLPGMPR